jgi:hypothetical protein
MKKDLSTECKEDFKIQEEALKKICAVCKNRACVRAEGAYSSWDERIQTQEIRFLNPNVVLQSETSRYEGLINLETMDYKGAKETWGVAKENPKPQVISEEKKSAPPQIITTKSFNVPAKEILIGNGITNTIPKKADPWAVSAKQTIKVGGTFKMGGDK